MSQKPEIEQQSLNIQLGDIIQLNAPSEAEIDSKIFLVKYIDNSVIRVVSVEDPSFTYDLIITEDGNLRNEAIIGIDILSSDEQKGYSRQNGLLPGTWIDVVFGGDLPTIITGLISNLEEDMIEIQTFPDNDKIYIDFAYKGIPLDLPIERINIREAPAELKKKSISPEGVEVEIVPEAAIEIEEQVEQLLTPEEAEALGIEGETEELPRGEVRKQIRELLINAGDIEIGEELKEINQVVDVPESEQRFGIDKQTSDLLDELLSNVPNAQRTASVLNNIHKMIERFKQLRQEFSKFDEYGNADMPAFQGAGYKPLVKSLKELNKKLYWILPVCKNKKKVYDVDVSVQQEYSDIVPLTFGESLLNEQAVLKEYNTNAMNGTSGPSKYTTLINNLNPFLTPFENPNYQEFSITSQEVNDNFAAIIDNLEDLQSSIVKNDNVLRRKFVIQTYNLGLSKLQSTENIAKKIYLKRVPLTSNDNIVINGFITLPEQTVAYSHINLPSTDILTKANLNLHNLNYWQFLKKNTAVNNYRVEEFKDDDIFQKDTYLNDIKEYTLNETIDSPDKYEKFLNTIIPKTRILFELVEKYITGSLSLYKIVKYLEPFLIYHKDLSFMQYKTMIEFISNKIREFNKNFVEEQKENKVALSLLKKQTQRLAADILTIFNSKFSESVHDFYGIDYEDELTNLEALNHIINFDGGRVFNLGVSLTNLSLASNELPDKLYDAADSVDRESKEANESNNCAAYVLSKRYLALDELEDDNGKEIYFDKQYDPTRYDIVKEYKTEQSGMSTEQFFAFLTKKLETNVKMSRNDAIREAQAMIFGKRAISDGEYALLETDEEIDNGKFVKKFLYYKRSNNIWVLDETINSSSFIQTTKMFCNIQPDCFQVKNKCEDVPSARLDIKMNNNEKVLGEYDEINYERAKKKIELSFLNRTDEADELYKLAQKRMFRYNNIAYKLGLDVENIEIKKSPYSKLRDLILGLADFTKKQQLIIKFVNEYTRDAVESAGENIYWLYCKETDVQLLPTFLEKLASAFISGENYFKEVEKICAKQGKLSDDGEAWVDQYSGYEIIKVSFASEEGYDEQGFKVNTRDLLEEEISKKVLQKLPTKDKYDTKEAQSIFNIVKSMSLFMGINLDDHTDFIIKNTIETLSNPKAMPTKQKYEKAIEAEAAKGVKKKPYEKAFDETLVYLTLSYLLIAVLTSIPSIKTRKTFPTCIRSFTGFPLTGIEDKTALVYISCITSKIGKASKPWSALQGTNQPTIASRLEKIINAFLLPNPQVQDLLTAKREFLESNPVEAIPEEHSISRWVNFLPPLKPIQIKSPQPVTAQFKETLLSYMREGNPKQSDSFHVLQNKIIVFSLAIQSLIQKVVSSETPILKTASNTPYLENSCCNSEGINTIEYFSSREPNILAYNEIVKEYGNIVYDAEKIAEANILLDPTNTKFKYPTIEPGFSEKVMYLAIITYCRFNNNIPISDDLRAICAGKPDDYNPDDSLEEKIRILKREGKNYSQDNFDALMDVVNRRNIVSLDLFDSEYSQVEKLRNLINIHIENDRATKFHMLLKALLDTYEPALNKETKEMKDMKNLLYSQNTTLKKSIVEFIKANTRLKKSEQVALEKQISTIGKFKLTKDTILNEEDQTTYKAINYIKNTIRNIIDVFPNIILNKVDYSDIKIPKQWGVSQIHALQIKQRVAEHYETLIKFYNDPELSKVATKIEEITRDLKYLAINTPFLSSIMRDDKEIFSVFDRDVALMSFEYYVLSAFKRYMDLADDVEILIKEVPVVAELPETVSSVQVQAALTGQISEIEIVKGEKKELSKKISSLLYSFTQIIFNDKKVINYNYDEIMENVLRVREREKDEITGYLGKMSTEEREVEEIFKNNKLGRWNIGLQKGLREYDPEFFDKEREKAEQMALQDIRLGKNANVVDLNREIFRMDMVERELNDAQADAEAYDLAVQPNDDDYGDQEGREDMVGYYYDMGGMQPDYD